MENTKKALFFANTSSFKGIMGLNFNSLIQISGKYTTKDVERALEDRDRIELIEMSNYFFANHGEYRNLIYRLANVNTYRYVVTPMKNYHKKNYKDINKQYQSIMDYALKTQIEATCNNIDFYVLRDGGFYGYEREMGQDIVLQQLPAKYCRSRFTDQSGNYAIEFNFKFFDDNFKSADERFEVFEQMPDEFEQLYNEYKSEGSVRGGEWKLLDMTKTRCHMLTDDGIPFFADVFDDLIKHTEYKEIDMLKSKLNLYKIVYQKVPLTKAGDEPITDEDEFQALHRGAKAMVGGDGIDVLTTICDVGSIDLSDKTEKASNFIENGLTNIYNSLSASQFLFNSGTKPSTTGLDKNIKSIEAMLQPLAYQHQRWYNNRFSRMNGSRVSMMLNFLGVTIWNEKDKVAMFKNQAMASGSKLLYFSSIGANQFMLDSLVEFENDYLKLTEKLKPLQTSHTQSSSDTNGNNDNGRPKANPDEASETTIRQKEDGTSDDRNGGASDG